LVVESVVKQHWGGKQRMGKGSAEGVPKWGGRVKREKGKTVKIE